MARIFPSVVCLCLTGAPVVAGPFIQVIDNFTGAALSLHAVGGVQQVEQDPVSGVLQAERRVTLDATGNPGVQQVSLVQSAGSGMLIYSAPAGNLAKFELSYAGPARQGLSFVPEADGAKGFYLRLESNSVTLRLTIDGLVNFLAPDYWHFRAIKMLPARASAQDLIVYLGGESVHQIGDFVKLHGPEGDAEGPIVLNFLFEPLSVGGEIVISGLGTANQYDCPADLNRDGMVDDSDFPEFVGAYDALDCASVDLSVCAADLNLDEYVDDADFVLFVSAYNELVCS